MSKYKIRKEYRKKLKPFYSGNNSRKFWNRVNKLPNIYYSLGCMLQELESKVLWQITRKEKENEKETKKS